MSDPVRPVQPATRKNYKNSGRIAGHVFRTWQAIHWRT